MPRSTEIQPSFCRFVIVFTIFTPLRSQSRGPNQAWSIFGWVGWLVGWLVGVSEMGEERVRERECESARVRECERARVRECESARERESEREVRYGEGVTQSVVVVLAFARAAELQSS